MSYDERRIVSNEVVEPERETAVVEDEPETVIERRPVRRTVVDDDPVGNAFASSQLIQTIVWAIVILVLLVVLLLALHTYAGLF